MSCEIRKILNNRYIVLFLALLVLCNGVLFWQQCGDDSPGYTPAQLQAKYASWQTLEEEAAALEDRIDAAAMAGDFEFVVAHSGENRVNRAALERIAQAKDYDTYRAGLIQQAQLMRTLGLMGKPGSFDDLSLSRGIGEYTALEGVSPEVCFTGWVELLTDWRIADVFVLLFGAVGGMMLLTAEKQEGYFCLLRTTRYGRGRLYIRKFGAMALLVSVGFVLLHGSQLLIVSRLFGTEHLSAPIQSIFGFNGSPLRISIGSYLLGLLGMKYLWALACAGIFFAVCSFARTQFSAMGAACGLLAVSLLLGQTDSLWLRTVSLSDVTRFGKYFQEAVYLNLLGRPMSRISFALAFLPLLLIAAFFLGMLPFCATPKGAVRRKALRLPTPNFGRHTSLLRHEGYKLYVLQGGILILVVFMAVQALSYHGFRAEQGEYERYYKHYSEILEGEPSEENAAFLESEAQRFQEIEEQLQQLQERSPEENAAVELANQLRPREAFEKARQQYEALGEGQTYLYETPYVRLFGEEGQREDLTNLAKAIFALTLALAGVFAVEHETGVAVLQTTAGKEKAVALSKLLHIAVLAALVWAVAFAPMCVCVFREIGAFTMEAQANSVSVLTPLGDGWTVGAMFAVSLFGKLILTEFAATTIFFISKKVSSTTVTMLLCLPMALIPLGIMILI